MRERGREGERERGREGMRERVINSLGLVLSSWTSTQTKQNSVRDD